jgi:hypothetical protein
MNTSESEVDWLMRQIEAANQAAQWAMYGPAQGGSTHQFITARMERMCTLHEQLKELIGEDADHFLLSTMDKTAYPNTSPTIWE